MRDIVQAASIISFALIACYVFDITPQDIADFIFETKILF